MVTFFGVVSYLIKSILLPLRQSVYYLPTARIHCPIYMRGEHPHPIYIYSLLPSMLYYLSTDTPATAVAVPVVIINTAKIRRKLLVCK